MNGKEQVFYIILILRNRRALHSNPPQIFINQKNCSWLSMYRTEADTRHGLSDGNDKVRHEGHKKERPAK